MCVGGVGGGACVLGGVWGVCVCVCVCVPPAHKEWQLDGWPAEGWAEGPLPKAIPLIHLNDDLEKLPFMGCDEVWIQSPSSLGSCHFLRCDCQLCQITSTGVAEGGWDWQGPLGKADIKRPCKLISVMGLSLTILFFFWLQSNEQKLVLVQWHHPCSLTTPSLIAGQTAWLIWDEALEGALFIPFAS